MKENNNRNGLFGGVILIAVGVLLFLNNFGLLPWSVWTVIWRFWPLFLIFGGLNILLGEGLIAEIVVSILTSIVVAFIIIQAVSGTNIPFRNWMNKHMKWIPYDNNLIFPRQKMMDNFNFDNQGFEN